MNEDMDKGFAWLRCILDSPPLFRLQNGQLTVLDLLKLAVLLTFVLALERYVRRVVLSSLLRRTKFEPSL